MIAATGVDESSVRYRGWRVVLACFLMAFFMFGFGLYGQGVYLAELQRAHGWPGTLVSAASTFSFLLTSVLVIFTDDLLARIGLRALILCGLSALAASTALLALMQTPWQLYLAYALMSVGWTGMGTVVIATVLNAWFERRRGLALSLAFNGATCGGIVLVPILLALSDSVGFRSAMLAATAAMVVLVLPVVVVFTSWPADASLNAAGPASGGGKAARCVLLDHGAADRDRALGADGLHHPSGDVPRAADRAPRRRPRGHHHGGDGGGRAPVARPVRR